MNQFTLPSQFVENIYFFPNFHLPFGGPEFGRVLAAMILMLLGIGEK
jgi:hypothetical protein